MLKIEGFLFVINFCVCLLDAEATQTMKKNLFLSFKSRVSSKGFEPSTRRLTIGCVKTSNPAKKVSRRQLRCQIKSFKLKKFCLNFVAENQTVNVNFLKIS